MTEARAEMITKLKADIKKKQAMLDELMPKDNIKVERYIDIENRVKSKPAEPKYATGVEWLDRNMRGGFTRGSFINLAGVSFSGKSTLVLKILSNIAEYNNAVLFSFEMYENILVQELKDKLNERQKANLLITQKSYNFDEIEQIIRDQAAKGVVFFAIDSKMKIRTTFEGKEYEKISRLSNELSKLTQELGIILLLINQINEEDRKNNKFGLKGSGDQQYDSDVILYINVEDDKQTKEERRVCYCSKDRLNKRKWKEDITEVQVEVKTYEDRKIEMSQI